MVPVDYRYGELPLDLLRALLTFDELLKLFLDLATRTGGDVEKALAEAPLSFAGEVENGGQDHFYLETQVTLAVPEEAGAYRLWSSTQHPSEVRGRPRP